MFILARSFKILVFVLIIAGSAHAFGGAAKFGSVTYEENATISFQMLFWGDNERVDLSVRDKTPGFAVSIVPDSIFLTSSSGDEYVSTGGGYSMATLVNITVTPPKFEDGFALIGARSRQGDAGISFFQDEYFNLTVHANKSALPAPDSGKTETDHADSAPPAEKSGDVIFYIALVIIVAASLLAYKYS